MAGCNSDSCDSMVSTASNHSQRVSHPVVPSPGTAHPSQHEIWVSFLLSSISVPLKTSPCRCCGTGEPGAKGSTRAPGIPAPKRSESCVAAMEQTSLQLGSLGE